MRVRLLAGGWLVVALIARASAGQQGSVQVTAAAQSIQGDPRRTVGQTPLEPDFGVSWLQPGTRVGLLQMELRATRRGDRPHVGKAFFSLRDAKVRGATWSFDAGDTYFAPAIGEYRFANLSTPSLTFAGASITGRSTRMTASAIVGRATAARNLFGTDPDTIDQSLAIARASYKATDRVELFTRASHVRTGRLNEYYSAIAASDEGGFATRWIVTPAVHLIADGSVVSYRRRDGGLREVDGSGLAGASLLLARGWIQVNAARFSPGELPILSQPLNDRQTLFAAGEMDAFAHLRVFAGWESFRSNLDPRPATTARSSIASDGSRGFAGIRTPIGNRSSVAVRLETGDRRSRFIDATTTTLSDTGILTAEWQTNAGALSAVARYSRRQNVESQSQSTSYTIDDSSGHLFFTIGPRTQLFGNAIATRSTTREGGGSTYWQIGGGGQTQMFNRSVWLRGEGTVSRNVDVLTTFAVPQQSLNVGLNGEIARNMILGLNVNADRLTTPNTSSGASSWVSRSMLRVTRSFQTGSARVPTTIASMARHGGTGSIAGVVFTDWNANGRQDAGEAFLENIPVRLSALGSSTTSKTGDFAFINVPIGLQQVGIDLPALPVDFDPPDIPQVQLQLGRGETKRVAFGLVPLNAVGGSVILDANGNGTADPGETPIEGAVVVLDAGARSERVRNGGFKFEAVRSGDHVLELLRESLPDGAAPAGTAQVSIVLTQSQPSANVQFLVTLQPRPETRRVFAAAPATAPVAAPRALPSRRSAVPSSSPAMKAESAPGRSPTKSSAPPSPPAQSDEGFAVQIVALNDPSRARDAVTALKAAGLPAYLVEPPASDPDGPYRVRLGRYATRGDAQAAAAALEKSRGEKYWVIRER